MAEIATVHRYMFQFNDKGNTIMEVSQLSFASREGLSLKLAMPAEPRVDLTYEDSEVVKKDQARLFTALNADAQEQKHS